MKVRTLRYYDLPPEFDPKELLRIRNIEPTNRAPNPRVDRRVYDVVDRCELPQRFRDRCFIKHVGRRACDGQRRVGVFVLEECDGFRYVRGGEADDMDVCGEGEKGFCDAQANAILVSGKDEGLLRMV